MDVKLRDAYDMLSRFTAAVVRNNWATDRHPTAVKLRFV